MWNLNKAKLIDPGYIGRYQGLGQKKKKKAVCKWTHVIQTHVLQGPTVFFWQLSSMQFSVVNYGHHAAHYIPMTNLFYSWIYLPFESKSKNF